MSIDNDSITHFTHFFKLNEHYRQITYLLTDFFKSYVTVKEIYLIAKKSNLMNLNLKKFEYKISF
jgi:hypothetical protein